VSSFITLLRQSLSACASKSVPLVFGILVFGSVLSFAFLRFSPQIALNGAFDAETEKKMEEMDELIKRGDEEGILRLSKELDMDRKFGNEARVETYSAEFFSSDLIYRITILFSATALVFLIAQIYFLETALRNANVLEILKTTAIQFPKMAGLSVVVFSRSLGWILFYAAIASYFLMQNTVPGYLPTILAIPPALFYLRRFVSAGMILAGGNKGIFESIRESYSQAKGSRGVMFAYLAGLGILIALAGFVSDYAENFALFARSFFWQFIFAFTVIYISRMNIMFNERFHAPEKYSLIS